jgi:hypothetical protein
MNQKRGTSGSTPARGAIRVISGRDLWTRILADVGRKILAYAFRVRWSHIDKGGILALAFRTRWNRVDLDTANWKFVVFTKIMRGLSRKESESARLEGKINRPDTQKHEL